MRSYRFYVLLSVCSPLLAGSALLMRNQTHVQTGQEAYRAGDFEAAGVLFRKALGGSADPDIVQYDLGTALTQQAGSTVELMARQQMLTHAIVSLRSALDSKQESLRDAALFNLGSAYLLAKDYERATAVYKRLLRDDWHNRDVRYNLEMAQRLRHAQTRPPKANGGEMKGSRTRNSSDSEGGGATESNSDGSKKAPSHQSGGGAQRPNSRTGGGPDDGKAPESSLPKPKSRRGLQGLGPGRDPQQKPPRGSGSEVVMRAVPHEMSLPAPVASAGVFQKLRALERRSGELRRKRVLHQTQRMLRPHKGSEKGE